MFRSYLNREAGIYLFVISLIFIFKGTLFANFTWFILLSLVIFIFRQNRINLLDNTIQGIDLIVSPLNGVVRQIIKEGNTTHILFKLSYFQEIGLYTPVDSEVAEVKKQRGPSFFRWGNFSKLKSNFESHYQFVVDLKTNSNLVVQLRIFKCLFGLKPSLSILGGDKTQKGARIGFIPFGGSILLSLPSEVEFLIKENDQVVAGETLICRLK